MTTETMDVVFFNDRVTLTQIAGRDESYVRCYDTTPYGLYHFQGDAHNAMVAKVQPILNSCPKLTAPMTDVRQWSDNVEAAILLHCTQAAKV